MAVRLTGLVLFSIALLWAGLAVAGQSSKDAPPELARSTDCGKAYDHYRRAMYSHYFALSEDGTACGYSYCTSSCTKTSSPDGALRECRNVSNGRACSIYAYRGSIVSKTGVRPGGGSSSQ